MKVRSNLIARKEIELIQEQKSCFVSPMSYIVGNASRVTQSQHCDGLTASVSALKAGRFVEFLFEKNPSYIPAGLIHSAG